MDPLDFTTEDDETGESFDQTDHRHVSLFSQFLFSLVLLPSREYITSIKFKLA